MNTGVDCHFLLQGIFAIRGSNPCLLHWQVDSSPLSHQRSFHGQIPVTTLGAETLGSFPGSWHSHKVTDIWWGNGMYPVSLHWKKTLGSLHLVSSRLCPVCLSPLLILLSLFTIVSYNHEFLSTIIYWILWVLLGSQWIWGWGRAPLEGVSYRHFYTIFFAKFSTNSFLQDILVF